MLFAQGLRDDFKPWAQAVMAREAEGDDLISFVDDHASQGFQKGAAENGGIRLGQGPCGADQRSVAHVGIPFGGNGQMKVKRQAARPADGKRRLAGTGGMQAEVAAQQMPAEQILARREVGEAWGKRFDRRFDDFGFRSRRARRGDGQSGTAGHIPLDGQVGKQFGGDRHGGPPSVKIL